MTREEKKQLWLRLDNIERTQKELISVLSTGEQARSDVSAIMAASIARAMVNEPERHKARRKANG